MTKWMWNEYDEEVSGRGYIFERWPYKFQIQYNAKDDEYIAQTSDYGGCAIISHSAEDAADLLHFELTELLRDLFGNTSIVLEQKYANL